MEIAGRHCRAALRLNFRTAVILITDYSRAAKDGANLNEAIKSNVKTTTPALIYLSAVFKRHLLIHLS